MGGIGTGGHVQQIVRAAENGFCGEETNRQRRILAWFGHYLKGEPAEPWITEGQSYLDRQAEVKRMTEKK